VPVVEGAYHDFGSNGRLLVADKVGRACQLPVAEQLAHGSSLWSHQMCSAIPTACRKVVLPRKHSAAACNGVPADVQDGYTVLDVRKNATKLVPPPALRRLGLLQPTSFRGDFRYLAMASGGDPQRLVLWDTVRNDTLMLGENDTAWSFGRLRHMSDDGLQSGRQQLAIHQDALCMTCTEAGLQRCKHVGSTKS
jgi:hypothetical protein